jgi:hypothetical protein
MAMLDKTAKDRYGKLKRVFARLMSYFNGDDLDDFVQTANSLREWVERGDTLTPEQKGALARFVVDESLDWQMCNQIANAQKHAGFKAPRSKSRRDPAKIPTVKAVHAKQGAPGCVLPPSMRVIGAGEEISIECDGQLESALAFVIRTFRHFHYIFEIAPIPPDRRVIMSLSDIIESCASKSPR